MLIRFCYLVICIWRVIRKFLRNEVKKCDEASLKEIKVTVTHTQSDWLHIKES